MSGMDYDYADITDCYTGNEQGEEDCKEWCDQICRGEDWNTGDYYWETEYEGKYLHMKFDVLKRGTGGRTMGRMIDTDELIDILGFENTQEERDENVGEIITLEDIDRIPTAYDPDKVVEQLEDRKSLMLETFKISESDIDRGRIYGMDKAIEIVKAGGTDEV